MPRVHFYVSDEMAERIQQKAQVGGFSFSQYVAKIVEKEFTLAWPDGYFETVVGSWQGEPLQRSESAR